MSRGWLLRGKRDNPDCEDSNAANQGDQGQHQQSPPQPLGGGQGAYGNDLGGVHGIIFGYVYVITTRKPPASSGVTVYRTETDSGRFGPAPARSNIAEQSVVKLPLAGTRTVATSRTLIVVGSTHSKRAVSAACWQSVGSAASTSQPISPMAAAVINNSFLMTHLSHPARPPARLSCQAGRPSPARSPTLHRCLPDSCAASHVAAVPMP